jgi:hypothetical protein
VHGLSKTKDLAAYVGLGMAGALAMAGCGRPAAGPAPGRTANVLVASRPAPVVPRHRLAAPMPPPADLRRLPPWAYLRRINPGLAYAHRVSTFIPGMGYHWVTPAPGLAVMTNRHNQVTAVEATFAQDLGQFSWWDPPTRVPNAGVAFNSEHLYFVPPAQITASMPADLPAALISRARFWNVNPRLKAYVRDGRMDGLTVYAPPPGAPGIRVLVNGKDEVAGFVVPEPARWGWQPYYLQAKGHPAPSRLYGRAYWSAIFLLPPHTAGAARGSMPPATAMPPASAGH